MRNLILALIFLGIAGYAAKVAFEKFAYGEGNFFEKPYAYPDRITVENKDGSKIQITLLGRSSSYIKFEKKGGRKFVYPISALSKKSQAMVMKYPENGIGDVSSYLSSGEIELKDVYVTQLEEEIRRMEAELENLEARANATQSKTELRTIERKMEALTKEIAEVRYKIANR